jgi:hypothetical protein
LIALEFISEAKQRFKRRRLRREANYTQQLLVAQALFKINQQMPIFAIIGMRFLSEKKP